MHRFSRDTECAWAAGFFDGEGTSGCYGASGRKRLYLGIDQAHPEVLERFHRALGVGHLYGPTERKGRSGKIERRWLYRVHGLADMLAVAEAVWPWLGEVKRDQLRTALTAFCDDRGLDLPKLVV